MTLCDLILGIPASQRNLPPEPPVTVGGPACPRWRREPGTDWAPCRLWGWRWECREGAPCRVAGGPAFAREADR